MRAERSEIQKIGAEFKLRRKRQSLTQSTVGKWVDVSQRQIGFFEKGKARLTEQQILTLNRQLKAAEEGSLAHPLPLDLLSVNDYLKIQGNAKESEVSDIWVFGPDKLSIFAQPAIETDWASCFASGAKLHFVWRLDVKMESYAMGLFKRIPSRIICDLKQSPLWTQTGSIEIYAIKGGNHGYESNTKSYRELETHFSDDYFKGHVSVHDPVDLSAEKFISLHPLLDLGRPYSVMLYTGKSDTPGVSHVPIAAGALIEGVSQKPSTTTDKSRENLAESGWVFLTVDAMYEIDFYTRAFMKGV